MNHIFFQKKLLFIIICLALVFMTSALFLLGEKKLNIESHNLQTYIIQNNEIKHVQSESFYRDLLNNEEEDIFILKTDSLIQFSTATWRERFGYTNEEVYKRNFFTFVHPKDLPFVTHDLLEAMDTGKKRDNIGPLRLKTKSGQDELFLMTIIPIHNDAGKFNAFAIVLHDLSLSMEDNPNMEHAALTKMISMNN